MFTFAAMFFLVVLFPDGRRGGGFHAASDDRSCFLRRRRRPGHRLAGLAGHLLMAALSTQASNIAGRIGCCRRRIHQGPRRP